MQTAKFRLLLRKQACQPEFSKNPYTQHDVQNELGKIFKHIAEKLL